MTVDGWIPVDPLTLETSYPNVYAICYLEMGRGQIATVDITFFADQRSGELRGPSEEFAAHKAEFGSSRIRRWFDREWTAT